MDLTAIAVDADGDAISLAMIPVGFELADLGATFSPANPITGTDSIAGTLELEVTCEMLSADFEEAVYELYIVSGDSNDCGQQTQDSVLLQLTLGDVEPLDVTAFANTFTPNGDNIGDFFRIDNLPLDDCQDQFDQIKIFNRWGIEVFQSDSREFSWDGSNLPSGKYFYIIYFGGTEYKGWIYMISG